MKVQPWTVSRAAANTAGGSWSGSNTNVLLMKFNFLAFIKSSGVHYLLD